MQKRKVIPLMGMAAGISQPHFVTHLDESTHNGPEI